MSKTLNVFLVIKHKLINKEKNFNSVQVFIIFKRITNNTSLVYVFFQAVSLALFCYLHVDNHHTETQI